MIREASTPSLSPVTAHPACPRCGGRLVQARGSHLPAVRLGRLQPQGRDLRDLPAAPAERPPSLLFGRLHVHLARAVAIPRPSGTVSGKAGAPSVRAHYCRPLLPAPSKTASGPHTAPGGCAASRKGQCLKRSAPRGQRPALRALPPGAQRLHQGGPPRRAGRLAVAASAASAPRAGSAPPTGYCTTPCRPPVELPANGFAVGPRGPASYKRS